MKLFSAQTFSLAGATGFSQGLLLLLSPVITRLYAPESFGQFGLALAIAAILATIGTGRLEHAIPVASGTTQAGRTYVLGMLLLLLTAAIASLAIGVAWAGNLTGDKLSNPWILAGIPIAAIALGHYQLASTFLLRHKRIGRVAINKVLQGMAIAAFQVVLGLLSGGGAALLLAHIAGYIAGCLAGMSLIIDRICRIGKLRGFELWSTAREQRKFPLILGPAALLNQLAQHTPLFAIGAVFGIKEAGLYALAVRICDAPLGLVGQAVGQVYAAQFKTLAARGANSLSREYIAISAKLFLVGLIVVGIGVAILVFASDRIFGAQWAALGAVALALSLKFLAEFCTTPTSMTLSYLKESKSQLIWDAGRLVAVLILFAFAYGAQLPFLQTLVLFSIVWAIAIVIHTGITYRACLSVQSTMPESTAHTSRGDTV